MMPYIETLSLVEIFTMDVIHPETSKFKIILSLESSKRVIAFHLKACTVSEINQHFQELDIFISLQAINIVHK